MSVIRTSPALMGKRVEHKHYRCYGRLTGRVKEHLDVIFFEVDTEAVPGLWWANPNVVFMGAIPLPQTGGVLQ